jgi:hypothetical protein
MKREKPESSGDEGNDIIKFETTFIYQQKMIKVVHQKKKVNIIKIEHTDLLQQIYHQQYKKRIKVIIITLNLHTCPKVMNRLKAVRLKRIRKL